jgi:hypothetical protein
MYKQLQVCIFRGFMDIKKTTAKGAILYFNREKQPYLKHKSSIIKKLYVPLEGMVLNIPLFG